MSVNHEREEKKVDENQRSYANIALFQLLMFRGVPGLFRARPPFSMGSFVVVNNKTTIAGGCALRASSSALGTVPSPMPPRAALRQPGGRGRPTRRGCRDEKSAGGSGPPVVSVRCPLRAADLPGQWTFRGSGFLEATAPTDVGNVPSVGAVMLCAPFPPSVRRGCWLREGSTFPFLSSAGHPGSA